MHRSLVNADAIFQEHYQRRGVKHSAWKDCKFLLKMIEDPKLMNFNCKKWYEFAGSQNGDLESDFRPSKTKPADLRRRQVWWSFHATIDDDQDISDIDRNTCEMTEPPQCINEKQFPGCAVQGDVITAYRNYYVMKTKSMKQGMRYLYSEPPEWLILRCPNKVQTERGKVLREATLSVGSQSDSKKINKFKIVKNHSSSDADESYELDDEGYVVVTCIKSSHIGLSSRRDSSFFAERKNGFRNFC